MMSRRRKSANSTKPNYQSLEARQLLATFVVNTTTDIANPIADGELSLREAIIAANTNQAYGDAPAGDSGHDFIRSGIGQLSIDLMLGEMEITESVTISNFEYDAARQSRIFRVDSAGQFKLIRSTLRNGHNDSGGAIFARDTNVILESVTIETSKANDGNGGAIEIHNGELATTNSIFEANYATGQGGAVSLFRSNWNDTSSKFVENYSEGGGGAIHQHGETAGLVGTLFSSNWTDGSGGNGGGAYQATGNARNELEQVTFDGNRTTGGHGGAIHTNSRRGFYFHGTRFNSNEAAHNGGAVHVESGFLQFQPLEIATPNATLEILNDFSANRAQRNGGAISATDLSSIKLAGVEGSQNLAGSVFSSSHGLGGLIFAVNSSVDFDGDNIKLSGQSFHAGGAIALLGGRLKMNSGIELNPSDERDSVQKTHGAFLSGTLMPENESNASSLRAGRSIYSVRANIQINGFRINGLGTSTVERGGGIYARGGRVNLQNVYLNSNSVRFGGGIFATDGANVSVNQSRIVSGFSWKGAAAFVNLNARLALNHSVVQGSAFSSGGGVQNLGTLNVNNTLFTGNQAYNSQGFLEFDNDARDRPGKGGAIYSSGTLQVIDSRFQNGIAGRGGAISGSGKMSIFRSDFHNNGATQEGAVYQGGYGGAIASDWQNNGFASAALQLNLRNVTFTSNIASFGGAISMDQGVLYGRNVTFGGDRPEDGNKTAGGNENVHGEGGALHLSGFAGATITNSLFKHNSATTSGGAIALVANGQITPYLYSSRTRFEHNSVSAETVHASHSHASQSGGAIANMGSQIDIRNSTFAQNAAAGQGGAIFNGSSSRSELRNVQIRFNHADQLAGGIFNDAQLDIFDSIISDNDADLAFGGIFESNEAKTNLVRTTVVRNSD